MDESGRWLSIVIRREDPILCFQVGWVNSRWWAVKTFQHESSKQDRADKELTCCNQLLLLLESWKKQKSEKQISLIKETVQVIQFYVRFIPLVLWAMHPLNSTLKYSDQKGKCRQDMQSPLRRMENLDLETGPILDLRLWSTFWYMPFQNLKPKILIISNFNVRKSQNNFKYIKLNPMFLFHQLDFLWHMVTFPSSGFSTTYVHSKHFKEFVIHM